MSTAILRTADAWWVESPDGARRIATSAQTTAELLRDRAAIQSAADAGPPVDPAGLALMSPVTAPCRVVAQMTNFASHAKDAGMDPSRVPLTFFRKASGSISGPNDDIVKPAHVHFLDYEVEVGLVFGRPLSVGTEVTPENLGDYIAGFVITNDVSARDLQLPKTQFFESKSYPTFTPVGPRLVLLDEGELSRFDDLRLRLWVNGDLRQDALIGDDILYRPLEALQTLSGFQRLDAGDLLLTGTPVGTALSAPPKPLEVIGSLLPTSTKWRIFFKKQAKNPKYLRPGDVVEVAVVTDDGKIDLGRQATKVTVAP